MITKRKKAWKLAAILVILLNSFFTQSVFSADKREGTIEFVLGSYNMSEPRFKAAYEKGGIIKGICFSASVIQDFDFYFEIKHFHKLGELTYTKEETKLLLIPISLGIRFIKPIESFRPFIGAGADLYFYYETNPIGTVINYTKGYHLQGGTYFQFTEKLPFWIGLKLKYTRAKTEESNHKLELGGFEYGISLVLIF